MWSEDPIFALPDVQPCWSALTAETAKAPRSCDAFKVIACAMGGALAIADSQDGDVHTSISKFYQFCTSELRTPKKELPRNLVEKLDKTAKDRFR